MTHFSIVDYGFDGLWARDTLPGFVDVVDVDVLLNTCDARTKRPI